MPMVNMPEIQTFAHYINAQILKANNILLVTHHHPDSDALGSICAFSKYLDQIGKNYLLFSSDKPLLKFAFLANFQRVKSTMAEIKNGKFDLILALDAGDLDHIGIKEIISPQNYIINIDHHPTNAYFGKINLILPQAVSTTEIIYHFFESIHQIISPEIATCLLAGIIGDTNNFTNHNTTHAALKIAANLLSAGASLTYINEALINKKSLPTINLWGKILMRLSENENFKTATTLITLNDLKNFSDSQKATEGLTNFLNNLAGVDLVIVLREAENQQIKVSLRSNSELIDLTEFVKIFNGGGHKKAAGFTIAGKLVETESGWQVV